MHRHLFSVDPGENNNGFCYFKYNMQEKKADLKIMKILSPTELENMLKVVWGIHQASPNSSITFVAENFRVDSMVRNKPHQRTNVPMFQWSEVQTIRQIGKVEMLAHWIEANFVTQEPAILAMARKWGPWKTLPKHIPDDKSAFLHGAKYMMDKMWINTVDQITMFGQEKL